MSGQQKNMYNNQRQMKSDVWLGDNLDGHPDPCARLLCLDGSGAAQVAAANLVTGLVLGKEVLGEAKDFVQANMSRMCS
jgi:hypothetical protein